MNLSIVCIRFFLCLTKLTLQTLQSPHFQLQGAIVGENGLHHMTIPQTRQRAGGQIATVGGVVQETWRVTVGIGAAKDLISADFVVTIYKKKNKVEYRI